MVRISGRLKAVASLVTLNSIVADIGADHGLLLVYLLENGIIGKGYGVENKAGPYKKLLSSVRKHPELSVYMADGLEDLPSDVNTLVLSGLGGNAIISIIERNIAKMGQIDYLIVSPHNDEYAVRKFLYNLKWSVDKELVVYDRGIFYQIMRFVPKVSPFLEDDLIFGHENLRQKTETFYKMLKYRKKQLMDLVETVDLPVEKKTMLLLEIQRIEKYDRN